MAHIITPSPKHHEFMEKLKGVAIDALKTDTLTAPEVLAITAQLVGILIALQDQRKFTHEIIMSMIVNNIEVGNQSAIAMVFADLAPGKH